MNMLAAIIGGRGDLEEGHGHTLKRGSDGTFTRKRGKWVLGRKVMGYLEGEKVHGRAKCMTLYGREGGKTLDGKAR